MNELAQIFIGLGSFIFLSFAGVALIFYIVYN